MRTAGKIIPVCRTQLGLNVFSVGEGGKVAPGVLNVLRGTPLDSAELSWAHNGDTWLFVIVPAYLTQLYGGWQMRRPSRTAAQHLRVYQHLCASTLLLNTVSPRDRTTLASTVNTDTHTYVRWLRISPPITCGATCCAGRGREVRFPVSLSQNLYIGSDASLPIRPLSLTADSFAGRWNSGPISCFPVRKKNKNKILLILLWLWDKSVSF